MMLKMLLVDDSSANLLLLDRFVQSYGPVRHQARNAIDAFALFEAAHQAGEPYELLLLDVVLGGMDGFGLLEKIRQWETKQKIKSPLPVCMVTSMRSAPSREKATSLGAKYYLPKPIGRKEVTSLFAQILEDLTPKTTKK